MKVFLSWSGPRGKAVAEALKPWLRQLIQALEPWISSDIGKGVRWSDQIAAELEQSRAGIICLTRDSLDQPWVCFEAGAISKQRANSRAFTFLLDVAPADVEPPLGQFQHTTFTKEDVRKLVRDINKMVQGEGERALPESELDQMFDLLWPKLSEKLEGIPPPAQTNQVSPRRSAEDMFGEVVELVRAMQNQLDAFQTEFQKQLLFGPAPAVPPQGKVERPEHEFQTTISLPNFAPALLDNLATTLKGLYPHALHYLNRDGSKIVIYSDRDLRSEIGKLVTHYGLGAEITTVVR